MGGREGDEMGNRWKCVGRWWWGEWSAKVEGVLRAVGRRKGVACALRDRGSGAMRYRSEDEIIAKDGRSELRGTRDVSRKIRCRATWRTETQAEM